MLSAFAAFAVPATPLPVEISLADGTTTQVYLRGDEYAHYYTTLDGTPIRIENGVIITDFTLPAQVLKKRRIAQQAAAVSQVTVSTVDAPRFVVLLVNFTDQKFIKTHADFNNLLNQSGYSENGGIGSVRDYFIASSDSLFMPHFDVYGPYDLPHDMAYYGTPSAGSHDLRADDMVIHACAAADEAGVDFTQYDTNGDGIIDNVFVYYAGYNQAEGAHENTIWPHRSAVYPTQDYDGVALYGYACTSELRYSWGDNMCGIGTFCHEFSHVLGLMDLYDTEYGKMTIGNWDIMSSGNYNGNGCMPPVYTAFERFSLGWLTPELLTDPQQYLLEPLETSNKAYMISATGETVMPNTNAEYFLLENRQYVGWDSDYQTIPGVGMLVWHVTYNRTAWEQNRPNSGNNLMCYIECATGFKQTEGSAADPFPGTTRKTMFMPILNDGTNLNKPLLEIQQLGLDIVFTFIRDGNRHLAFTSDEMITLNSNFTKLADGKIKRNMPVQVLTLAGSSLDPNQKVMVKTSKVNFQISLDTLNRDGWKSELSVPITQDSTLYCPLYVRYRPSMLTCDYDEGNIQAKQGAAMHIVPVRGMAPRAKIITEPVALQPTNVSPYSAELNWEAVADASHYYATIYQLKEGETSFIEEFENFDSPSDVMLAGWQTNFTTLSSTLKASGHYSLWVKETGNQMVSPTYEQPISKLSFWYSVPTTDIDTIGYFLLEGYTGEEWALVDSVVIKRRDHKKTYSYDTVAPVYIQFRLSFVIAEESDGVCIDNFTAMCDKEIDYLYKGEELTLNALNGEKQVTLYLENLMPDTEYFYKIRVSDKGRGGCQEYVVEMKDVQSFKTLNGKNDDIDLAYGIDSIHYSQPEHVIYVPVADGDRTLYFYDMMGQLIGQVSVAEHQNRVPFPEGNFISGNIYIVKYAITDKLKRKDRRIKIIY